jgi:hypothetical protein
LTKPLDGWFGDYSVQLVEVSARGAAMLHEDELPIGARALLRFAWRGEELEITAEIARTTGQRSGIHFIDDSADLRRMIELSALELLRAQEANATGDRERNVIGDETLTAASAGARALRGYLVFELDGGKWKSRVALVPDQPANGFTVAANESDEQIDLLCRTFESGGEEERRMTRMIAQLSISR